MRQLSHLLPIYRCCTLLTCLFIASVIQGCFTMTCTNCGDKISDGKQCGQATAVVLECKDHSIPRDGMCSNGEEAVPVNGIIPQACVPKPAPCGSICYDWQLGKTGCDTSRPNAKCTNYTWPNGSCECRCL